MLDNNIYTQEYAVTILEKKDKDYPHFIVEKEAGVTESLPLINDPENYATKFMPGEKVLLTHMYKKLSYEEYKNNNDIAGKESMSAEEYEQSNTRGTHYGFRLKPYVLETEHEQGSKSI